MTIPTEEGLRRTNNKSCCEENAVVAAVYYYPSGTVSTDARRIGIEPSIWETSIHSENEIRSLPEKKSPWSMRLNGQAFAKAQEALLAFKQNPASVPVFMTFDGQNLRDYEGRIIAEKMDRAPSARLEPTTSAASIIASLLSKATL